MNDRCYTLAQVIEKVQMARRTFYRLKAQGELVFLEEILPRAGRRPRYRADLVDRWVANQWTGPRAFRRSA